MNANITKVATGTTQPASLEKRPLVAVGYGPRCVPALQIAEAAANVCDLLWLIDGSLPEMRQMSELLNRFGPVVDVTGLGVAQILDELSAPYEPDGLVTYLDANMGLYAEVAAARNLPFHSLATSVALTDKYEQRRVLANAGIDVPSCRVIAGESSRSSLSWAEDDALFPAVLKPRSAQGSRYTFFVSSREPLDELMRSLGPDRPEMVLEGYIPDDPARAGGPYAAYVSVESIVAGGVVSHLALTGRFPLAENFRETGFFIPASLDDDDERAALELASASIEALGVTTGCLHTEVKFTAEGARLIEVNGRVGGGVPEMLNRAAGLALVELTLRVALGEAVHINGPVDTTRIGYRFFLQPPDVSATVAAISGVDAVSDFPGVDSITVHQGPGADFDWKDGSRNHILAVVGSADDYVALQAVDRLLHQEVTVTYADVSHS